MNNAIQSIWSAFLTATVVTMLAGLFVAALPPVYRATATVKGTPDGMLIIQSGELLAQVMQTAEVRPDDLYGWTEEIAGADVDGAALLQQKLFVSRGAEAGWIDITVEGGVAQSTARLANEIAKAYLDRVRQNELTLEAKQALYLVVETREAELSKFLQENPKLVDFRAEKNRLDTELRNIDQRVKAEQLKRTRNAEQIDFANQRSVSALNDTVVKQAARERDLADQSIASLTSRYGNQHQKLRQARAKFETAESQLNQAFANAISRLNIQDRHIEDSIRSVEAEHTRKAKEVEELLALEAHHAQLKLARQSALDRFNGMTREQRRYEFAEAAPTANTLGYNQMMLLVGIFLTVFVLVQVLMLLRGRMK